MLASSDEARPVHHHRAEAQVDRALEIGREVDVQAVLVDHRDVILVQTHVAGVLPLVELGLDRGLAYGLELDEFQPGDFDQREGVLVRDGLGDRFHHRQIRDVEGGKGNVGLVGPQHDLGGVTHGFVCLCFVRRREHLRILPPRWG